MTRTATRRDLVILAALALAVLAATFAFEWSRADDASSWDVPLYESFGERIADGAVPYRDARIEYPPGSLPAFVLPALASDAFGPEGASVYEPGLNDAARSYSLWFALLMVSLLAVTIAATAASLGVLAVSVAQAGAALVAIGSVPLALGELAFTRFDALPVALTAVATALVLAGRTRLAGATFGLAVAAKLYPVLLVPLATAYVLKRHGRREAWLTAACASAVAVAVCLPFAALAPGEMWFSLRSQLTRGLQVESLAGSAVLALDGLLEKLGGAGIASIDEGGTGDVRSADVVGSAGATVGTLCALLALGVVAWIAVAAFRGNGSSASLVRGCAAVIAAQLALGRVLSPQFVLWLLPLVPLVPGRRGRVALGVLALAIVATHLWFPDLYRDYVNERTPVATAFLLGRNALLVAVLAVLIAPAQALRTRSPSTPTAASRRKAGARTTA